MNNERARKQKQKPERKQKWNRRAQWLKIKTIAKQTNDYESMCNNNKQNVLRSILERR